MNRYLPLILLLILIFNSCASRIDGSLSADGSAVLNVGMSLEPRITLLIRNFFAAGGQSLEGNILDAQAITQSMSRAPGVSSVSFKNTSAAAIEGQIRVSKISDLLAAADKGFIIFEQNNTGTSGEAYRGNSSEASRGGRCEIKLNRENGPHILRLLSLEIYDYLYTFSAPIATGEELTKAEYLNNIALDTNKAISDEIASSRFRASIDFPGNITEIKGGTYKGKTASFDIPLLDLLVLESPAVFEVKWK